MQMGKPAAKLVLLSAVLLLATGSYARSRRQWGQGFSTDLNQTYDEVIKIVQKVVDDGVIRGTSQYRGTKELDGAKRAETAEGLPSWTGPGTVLYKTRPGALAPEHFYASGNEGTVVVRYIVQTISPNLTRLRIDATFDADDHHGSHPSDGEVEKAEFASISEQLSGPEKQKEKSVQADDTGKPADQQQNRAAVATAKAEEQLSQPRQDTSTAQVQPQPAMSNLEAELEKEKDQLQATKERAQQVQKQIQDLQRERSRRVRSPKADLKAQPYNQSKTLYSLSQGASVLVLLQTPNWYRVQTADGQQGWIYRLLLEPVQ
jgi:flagellar biosynthesis GTPase FlhF